MKSFLATFIGVFVAIFAMMGIQMVGHNVFPVPPEINFEDPASLSENMHLIPAGSFIFILLAHSLGQLFGLLTAKLIDKTSAYPVYIIAGFLLLGTVANLVMIPHPVWFSIVDVLLMIAVALPFVLSKKK
ncbi:MAG: hypothetical protein QNK23_01035 [Crocinitomicaceae bacterium]|nr:hypothetical protein [Crocinitomicaceae bacterium]